MKEVVADENCLGYYEEMRERWNIVHTREGYIAVSKTVTNEPNERGDIREGSMFVGGWPVSSGGSSILNS
ncbi:hypothetical protein EVAR_96045_1 [Eumeta japonica]|uniref:Uncharacterized protein n=1 Tax=Eumeta variegata TaxID=151549 RepID=A0A4C1W857_EUMVA|nr:hypothetical protein EVAR_96045_1 [Eumeta japonica]